MPALFYVAQLIAACALASGQGMFFKSAAVKGYGNSEPDKILGPYYIPDRQCTGVVHNISLACEYVDAVRVEAVDGVAYPEVGVEPLLERALVRRRAGPHGCRGAAEVRVAVACGEARRRARALADATQLPPLPRARSLPPKSPPPLPPYAP